MTRDLVIYSGDCIWKRDTQVFDPCGDNHLGCVVNSQTKPIPKRVYSRHIVKQWRECPIDCMMKRDADAWVADRIQPLPAPVTPDAALRAIVNLCNNAKPGNERVVLDNIRDVAEAAMKGRK